MNNDRLYTDFVRRWNEVVDLPPQTVGPFTSFYKQTVPLFKTAPWRFIIPLSIVLILGALFVSEITAVGLTSFLQTAF